MIPLKGDISAHTLPIITVALIFVNLSVFFIQRLFTPASVTELMYLNYGLIPDEFLRALRGQWGLLPYNITTLFSSLFLHGGFFHLAGNMLYLWIFGNNIEDAMGHGRYVFFYFLSGIFASVFQIAYDPVSMTPIIGASGAISGILGAYLVLYPLSRIKTLFVIFIFFKIVELPAVFLLSIWFFIQIVLSFGGGGIAWYAHIGGFISGLLLAKLFIRKSYHRGIRKRRVPTNS